jgi:hypothetical protein
VIIFEFIISHNADKTPCILFTYSVFHDFNVSLVIRFECAVCEKFKAYSTEMQQGNAVTHQTDAKLKSVVFFELVQNLLLSATKILFYFTCKSRLL